MISVSVKTTFKRRDLTKRVEAGKRRLLFGFGGLASKTARNSIKPAPKKATSTYGELVRVKRGKNKGKQRFKRGKYSQPGKPPFYRANKNGGLRAIRFEVNLQKSSVKFGPIKTSGSKQTSKQATTTQEKGGGVTYRPITKGAKPVRVQYRPRPYILPAATKSLAKFRSSARKVIR